MGIQCGLKRRREAPPPRTAPPHQDLGLLDWFSQGLIS
jgi:hypothetical protein